MSLHKHHAAIARMKRISRRNANGKPKRFPNKKKNRCIKNRATIQHCGSIILTHFGSSFLKLKNREGGLSS
jgi:hypothetical protein